MRQSQESINQVARQLIQEKKLRIQESEHNGKLYEGRDLLSLLRMFLFTILDGIFFFYYR